MAVCAFNFVSAKRNNASNKARYAVSPRSNCLSMGTKDINSKILNLFNASTAQTGTRNALISIFKKEGSTQTYDIEKNALARALENLERWQSNPGGTNFSSILYGLMAKADNENFEKLFNGFPVRTTAYILWYWSIDKEELFNRYVKEGKLYEQL